MAAIMVTLICVLLQASAAAVATTTTVIMLQRLSLSTYNRVVCTAMLHYLCRPMTYKYTFATTTHKRTPTYRYKRTQNMLTFIHIYTCKYITLYSICKYACLCIFLYCTFAFARCNFRNHMRNPKENVEIKKQHHQQR